MHCSPILPPVSGSSGTQHRLPRPTVLRAAELRTKVKRFPPVMGPKAMVLEGKIAVNVAKFPALLPPQDAPNPAVTAVTVQPPARVAATVMLVLIDRSVRIVA